MWVGVQHAVGFLGSAWLLHLCVVDLCVGLVWVVGVVVVNCIVVASILGPHCCLAGCVLVLWGVGLFFCDFWACCVRIFCGCGVFFSVFVCRCFRAFGGCLGMKSR